jgi:hypothetical protein
MAIIRSTQPLSFPSPTIRPTPNPTVPAPGAIVDRIAHRLRRNDVGRAPDETKASGRTLPRYWRAAPTGRSGYTYLISCEDLARFLIGILSLELTTEPQCRQPAADWACCSRNSRQTHCYYLLLDIPHASCSLSEISTYGRPATALR